MPVRTGLALQGGMLMFVLAGVGAWFIAALGIGIVLGKLISAHERSDVRTIESSNPSAPRAA